MEKQEEDDSDTVKEWKHCKSITLKPNTVEEDWKKLCIKNFDFVQEAIESNKDPKITAAKLASQSDYEEVNMMRIDLHDLKKQEDKLGIEIRTRNEQIESEHIQSYSLSTDYDSNYTYKQLCIKLTFEYLQRDLQHNQDFEILYEYIKTFKKDLTSIKLKMIAITHLKSKNYWLMSLIPKLTSLKTLILYQNEDQYSYHYEDLYKYLAKAMAYFSKNGGALEKFHMANMSNNENNDLLYQSFKCIKDIQILSLMGTTLTKEDGKAIGKILSDFKNIRELDLRKCQLGANNSKEIADGLMRAK